MAKSTLTYLRFAEIAIMLAQGDIPADFNADAFIEKAQKLIERETAKSEYAKENKKPTESKVSETTIANAKAILSVLSTTPMTTGEINTALGVSFEPLTVSNAIRYIERTHKIVKSKKVETVEREKNGVVCLDQAPRTAYALAD